MLFYRSFHGASVICINYCSINLIYCTSDGAGKYKCELLLSLLLLWVYVCMYVCICICIYVCMYAALLDYKLDYCNSLFYGLPDTSIKRLQRVQNSLARVIFPFLKRSDHMSLPPL